MGKNTIIFTLLYMKKNKKFNPNKKTPYSNSKLLDLVVNIFRQNPNKKLNYKQIAKLLKIKELGVKIRLVEILKKMASSKFLEETQRGSYRIIERRAVVFAKIKNVTNSGVYIKIDDDREVFISKKNSQFALTGDEVEVLLFPKRKKKQEGEVVRVVERKKEQFVGVIDNTSSNHFLIPDDKRVSFDIFLPPKNIKKTFLCKKLLVRVESWDNKYKNPIGKIVKVIGNLNDNDVEIKSILFDSGFSADFSKKVDLAANKIEKTIPIEGADANLARSIIHFDWAAGKTEINSLPGDFATKLAANQFIDKPNIIIDKMDVIIPNDRASEG